MINPEISNFRILSSFRYIFNQSLEQVFHYFLHLETIDTKEYKISFFNFNSIPNNQIKTYYITIDTYINDVVEIKTIQISQDKYYSSLTNLVTKINGEPLEHPIWIEHKFFFDSCTNTTLLILDNKIQENSTEISDVLKELINPEKLTKLCVIINDHLLKLNKNIVHTESVLILRPIYQVWKCISDLDFWKLIYRENKYSLLLDDGENTNIVVKLINIVNNSETVYKVKKMVILNDRISLRILKQSKFKNSLKKYISISILSISQITCYLTMETEVNASVNLDFLKLLSQSQQYILKNLKNTAEKLPCETYSI